MKSQIRIPAQFAALLRDSGLDGPVRTSVTQFVELFDDPTRGLPFFPEYTDHGVEHFQRVLDAMAWLLVEDHGTYLTAEDAGVAVVAALLHDSAMHLTEDGFSALIKSPVCSLVVPEIDKKSWFALWEDYLAEVSRWGDKRLRQILREPSNSSPLEPPSVYVELLRRGVDNSSIEDWTRDCRKIVGDFIRRHHGRMAHEFSLIGLPSLSNHPYQPISGMEDRRDLCGLVARSHCLALRETFSYLMDKYSARVTCLGCHPVLLMVLLRIADYLDIEATRAPSVSLMLRRLRSPFSQREWAVHQAIREVRPDEFDVHAIFVDTIPKDVSTFLRVKDLLDSLQQELDTSWAVLGEVFSRSEQNAAAIRLRRVRSTLDTLEAFRRKVPYVPAKFSFHTADAKLLHKLVTGLYGVNVEVGIRELLQNALDAVNELTFLRPSLGSEHQEEAEIRVLLEGTDDAGGSVVVEDYGIGMDEEVLSRYFLCAGMSFRDSDAWKKAFIKGEAPQVTRTGRFGVGVLAAFLLGGRIEVVTRHYQAAEDKALRFSASLDDDVIDVMWETRTRPGTTIRIEVNGATYARLRQLEGLEWDWYRWRRPRIARAINGNTNLPNVTRLPAPDEPLPEEWHRLAVDGYESVIWTYGRAPALACNGLTVGSSASSYGYRVQLHWSQAPAVDFSIPVRVPCVSVLDRCGRLPVDMQRFSLQGNEYPFADELLRDIAHDYYAFCLVFPPSLCPVQQPCHPGQLGRWYPGWAEHLPSFQPATGWLFTTTGAAPLHCANLARMTLRRCIVLLSFQRALPFPPTRCEEGDAVLYAYMDHTVAPEKMLPIAVTHLLGRIPEELGPHPQFFDANEGAIIFGRREIMRSLAGYVGSQAKLESVDRGTLVQKGGEDTNIDVWRSGIMRNGAPSLPSVEVLRAVSNGYLAYAELQSPQVTLSMPSNAFTRTWQSVIAQPIIPLDAERLREILETASSEVRDHAAKWCLLKKMGDEAMYQRFHRERMYNERL